MRSREIMLGLALAVMTRGALSQEFVNIAYVPTIRTIYGAEAGDAIGETRAGAPAVGDLSGDGIPDLVIATPWPDGPGNVRLNTGQVDVIFGPFTGRVLQDMATSPADLIIYGRDLAGRLGSSLAVADMNGDGQVDLVVGQDSTARPDTNRSLRGEVCIFFGPLSPGIIDLAADEPDLAITGLRAGDRFGSRVAVGDVSGDGVADLVVAAEAATIGARLEIGTVAVLYGPFQPGPTRHLSVTPPDLLIVSRHDFGLFGYDLAVGDVSGDGIADIAASAIGAPNPLGAPGAGQVDVIFGGLPAGTTVDLLTTPSDVIATGADADDWLGQSLAIGDMTGDGVPELFIGAWQADGPGNALLNCGELQVFLGPLATGTIIDNVATLPDVTFISHRRGRLGCDVDVGTDVDGRERLLVSAFEDTQGCASAGVVSLLDVLPPRGTIRDLGLEPAPFSFSSRLNTSFGSTCILRDVTGDGIGDPIISSRYDGVASDRQSAGAVHIVAYEDRCEEDPPGLGPSGLHVRRAGDDVLLDFDEAGLGVDSIGVDLFRGTLREFKVERRHDHVLMTPCGLLTSPGIDVGAAAPGVQHYYYLGTRGCPDACSPYRSTGDLGDSSTGQRPYPRFQPDTTCR